MAVSEVVRYIFAYENLVIVSAMQLLRHKASH